MDWKAIDQELGSKSFKGYAPEGEHEAKLKSVAIKDNPSWKSPAIDIEWEEDDQYKYPRNARHWLSLANEGFRGRHIRRMLVEFGISQAAAEQAIDGAEKKKENREDLVKAYQQIFDRAVSKHPTVKIVVRPQERDGKPVLSDKGTAYTEAEFATRDLNFGGAKKEEPKVVSPSSLDAEELEFTGEIPF